MTQHFVSLCDKMFSGAESLYILGDFIEYWLGDDQQLGDLADAFSALQRLKNSGAAVYFMHGNRDFLLSETFAQGFGCELLKDPTLLQINGKPTALLHGDTLCTDDTAYLEFRKLVRSPQWQQAFLAKPLQERVDIATGLRETSKQATQEKNNDIMDVNPLAVQQLFREQKVMQIIHGHTHRPGIHDYQIDGQLCQRIVLGDWYKTASILVVDNGHMDMQTIPLV